MAFTLWEFPSTAVGKNLTACLIFQITVCDRLCLISPHYNMAKRSKMQVEAAAAANLVSLSPSAPIGDSKAETGQRRSARASVAPRADDAGWTTDKPPAPRAALKRCAEDDEDKTEDDADPTSASSTSTGASTRPKTLPISYVEAFYATEVR